MLGNRQSYQQHHHPHPGGKPRVEGPGMIPGRQNPPKGGGHWGNQASNGWEGDLMNALPQESSARPTVAPPARKGLCIIDPSDGKEVVVEAKNDGKMRRSTTDGGKGGKGDGKGGDRRRNSRVSTIGGRPVTTIGGKEVKTTYASYDPTSNDYEDSPKSTGSKPTETLSPMPTSPPQPMQPTGPTPHTAPPISMAPVFPSPPHVSPGVPTPPAMATAPASMAPPPFLNMPPAEYATGPGTVEYPPAPAEYSARHGDYASADYALPRAPESTPQPVGSGFPPAPPASDFNTGGPWGVGPGHGAAVSMAPPAGMAPQRSQPMFHSAPHHYSPSAPTPAHVQQPASASSRGKQQQQHQQHQQGHQTQQEAPLDESKMSKTQLKNKKKHERAKEKKAKELRDQAEDAVLAWRTSVLALPLTNMGFPRERCYAAVCACSDGKSEVDLERCVAWLLSDQLFRGKHADLDISTDLQKMSECEAAGFARQDIERAVLAHGGDVDTACIALQSGSFTVSAVSA